MIRSDKPVSIVQALNVATFLITFVVFLSVFSYLDPLIPAVFVVLTAAALVCEYKEQYIPRIVLNVSTLIVLAVFIYKVNRADLAPLTVEALLILLAVKLLEKKRFRDYVQIYLIAVFLLSGGALLGISLIFLFYVLVLLFLFCIAMIFVAYFRDDPDIVLPLETVEKIIMKGSLIPVCAIPLAVLLFVVTPRSPFPILDFLNQKNRALTGFTDQISLGKVSEIQEDARPIFRASMDKVPDGVLYWRGMVLDYFDGSTWRSANRGLILSRPIDQQKLKNLVWQDIYIEPYGNAYLFGLDQPLAVIFRNIKEFDDMTFASQEPIMRKARYRVASQIQLPLDEQPRKIDRYLQLPRTLSPEVLQLADRLKAGNQKETLDTTLKFLNSKNFSYSLKNLPMSNVPLDDFLFKLRYGNCEYYASAFAVLARINRIPARLVAGYQGGIYNDLGRYYLVSQKQAHVWVETFIEGKGWVRYDPTPGMSGARTAQKLSLLSQAGLYLDMINYYWIAFVVNYDLQKQVTLFSKVRTAVGGTGIKIGQLPFNKIGPAVVILALAVFAAYFLTKYFRKSDAERLVGSFLACLEKFGYVKGPSEGLEEFADKIHHKESRLSALDFVQHFEEVYYRDFPFSPEEKAYLRSTLRNLRNQLKSRTLPDK
jgi:protein-glutamine gamma-glutamyltransferase